jgi:hypothetical protein
MLHAFRRTIRRDEFIAIAHHTIHLRKILPLRFDATWCNLVQHPEYPWALLHSRREPEHDSQNATVLITLGALVSPLVHRVLAPRDGLAILLPDVFEPQARTDSRPGD